MADVHEAGDLIAQSVADANVEAPETEPSPSSGGADTGAAEGGADLILGKFKDTDAVIEAYKNLEPQFTQTRQQLSELQQQWEAFQQQPQEQEETSPFGVLGVPMPGELEEWAAVDPGNAYAWALQNEQQLGFRAAQIQNSLFTNWLMQDAQAATDYRMEWREYQRQLAAAQNEPEETSDPYAEYVAGQIANAAYAQAQTTLPDFEQHQAQVAAWIEANPAMVAAITQQNTGRPDSLYQVIRTAYRLVVDAAPQTAPSVPAPPAQVQGQTRSSAPGADDDHASGVQDLLLRAAAEQGMRVHQA